MTAAQFKDEFSRALQIGGWRREEIVEEITSHVDESDQSIPLGTPRDIAHQLDAVHLGWWRTPARVILLPVAGVFFLTGLRLALTYATDHKLVPSVTHVDDFTGAILFFYLWLYIPSLIALLTGFFISRLHRPARVMMWAWIATILVGFLLGVPADIQTGIQDIDVPDTLGGLFFSSLFVSIVKSTFFMVIAMVPTCVGQHILSTQQKRSREVARWQASIRAILTFVAIAWPSALFFSSLLFVSPAISIPFVALQAWLLVSALRQVYIAFRLPRTS